MVVKRILISSAVCFFMFCMCNSGLSYDNKQILMINLESMDPITASKAYFKIFDQGKQMIPYLIKNLDSIQPYKGECGRHYWRNQEVLTDETVFETVFVPLELREISLFLIIAILKNDLSFRCECKLDVLNGNRDKLLESLFAEIAEEYNLSKNDKSRNFTSSKIITILKKYNADYKPC